MGTRRQQCGHWHMVSSDEMTLYYTSEADKVMIDVVLII